MKIIIADDHPLTLQGTRSYIESLGYKVIEACSNGISACNAINLHTPDIAILDINMPGLDGLDVAKKVLENKWKTKVVLLTMHKEMTVYKKATAYGVYGYILKEYAHTELEKCLNEVSKGDKYISAHLKHDLTQNTSSYNLETYSLTLSEKKIIELIAQQKTSKQIADLLFLSERTIEGHRTNIIVKLGLPKEKNVLLMWALQNVKNI